MIRRDIVFKDIDLNFTAHPITKDLPKLNNAAAVLRAIKNLVLTRRYEYFYRPDIHSRVSDSLFEPYTPFLLDDLHRSIKDVITAFEPRVELIDVSVAEDLDNNGYSVSILLRVLNSKEPIETTFFLQKLR